LIFRALNQRRSEKLEWVFENFWKNFRFMEGRDGFVKVDDGLVGEKRERKEAKRRRRGDTAAAGRLSCGRRFF